MFNGGKEFRMDYIADAPTVDGAALEQIHGSIRLEFPSEEMRSWNMEILRMSV
jgi:hypothetical protein